MIRTRGKRAATGARGEDARGETPAARTSAPGGAPQESSGEDNQATGVPADAPDKHEALALAEKNQHKLPPRRIPRG